MTYPTASMRTDTVTVEEAGNKLADALNNWLVSSGPSAIYKNCDNCHHMTEEGPAFCKLHGVTPPCAVIVVGCDQHEDKEDIPF